MKMLSLTCYHRIYYVNNLCRLVELVSCLLCYWSLNGFSFAICSVNMVACVFLFFCFQIMKEDDNNWPEPDRVGRQELEIVMGNEHISFTTSKIGSLVDVQSSNDPEGLRIFYYLVQVS